METLADWIRTHGALAPNEAVAWTIRLSRQVATMHESGVAHGNISPACVLVTRTDPRSRGLMSDVRRTSESMPFHSPERIRGGGISTADDTWAVAATLYTLLTSSPPFVGQDRDELAQQILRGTPAPLAVFGVDDEAIEEVLADAFSSDPARRITTISAMRVRLEQLLPDARSYPPLEDEDGGEEEDTGGRHEVGSPTTLERGAEGLFAPEEVRPASEVKPAGAPIGEQDETVMRELPAHIIAMAARAAAGSSPPPAPVSQRAAPPAEPPVPPRPPEIERESGATRIAPVRDADATRIAPARIPLPRMQSDVDDEARTGESRAGASGVASSQRGQRVLEPPRPRPGFADPSRGPVSSSPPPLDPDDVRTVMHGAQHLPLPPITQPHHAGAPLPPPLPPAPPVAPEARGAFAPSDDDDDDGGRTVLRESPLLRPPGAPPPGAPPPGGMSPQWKPAAPPRVGPSFPAAPPNPPLRPSPATQLSPGSVPDTGTQRPAPPHGFAPPMGQPQPNAPMPAGMFPGGSLAPAPQGDVSNLIQETLESMGRSGAFPPPSGALSTAPGSALSGPPMMPPQQQQQQQLAQQQQMSLHPSLMAHMQAPSHGPQAFAPAMPRDGAFQGNITGSDEIELMRRGRGTGRLVSICLLVLLLAAGVTFALLKYGPAYGIHVPLP